MGGRKLGNYIRLHFSGFLGVKVSIACLCLRVPFLSLCLPYLQVREGSGLWVGGSRVSQPLSFRNLKSFGLIKIVGPAVGIVLRQWQRGRSEEEVAEKEGVS